MAYIMNETTLESTSWAYPTTSIQQDTSLEAFSKTYALCHGPISAFICIFGIVSNIVNVVVLTRKHMISPTNNILTALAFADILTMASYLPYAIYFYIISELDSRANHNYGWATMIIFNNYFVVTSHTMAMWLTVALAVFRYIFVCHPGHAMNMCSLDRAKLTILVVFFTSIIICIPMYLTYRVIECDDTTCLEWNGTAFWVDMSLINYRTDGKLLMVVEWVYGVIMKIAPCIILTFLSIKLIIAMQQAKQRRARLLAQGRRGNQDQSSGTEHNRTTAMLVAVVISFIITELPQGLLAMLRIVPGFVENVYSPMGDFMDFMVLVNSAVNFILYCIMSQQFRDTFKSLFSGACASKLFMSNKPKENGISYSNIGTTEVTRV